MTILTPEIVERAVVTALVVLARKNIPPDFQELLTSGNPVRDIPPHALRSALEAVIPSLIEECAKVAERKIKERARDSTVYMGGPSEYQKGRESMNHDISITVPTAIRSLIPSKEKDHG